MKMLKEWKEIATPDEKIVGMVQYKDQIIVATSSGVYRLKDGAHWEPIKFEVLPDA